MDGVVGADQKIGTGFRKLLRRRKHQLPDALPVIPIDALHIRGKRVRMQGDFGVIVCAQKLRAFDANGAITQSRAFSRARDDADVLGHWRRLVGRALRATFLE